MDRKPDQLTKTELKLRFSVEYIWKHLGLPGEPKRSCHSPFREDREKSFFIVWNDGRGSYWKDYGTGESGDVIAFLAKANGITPGQAIGCLRELAGASAHPISAASPQTLSAPPHKLVSNLSEVPDDRLKKSVLQWVCFSDQDPSKRPLSYKERATYFVKEAVRHLMHNTHLLEQVANWKGISRDTVYALAQEGSLGWIDGRLAFIYETGVKLRQGIDVPKEERFIQWGYGIPFLWRGWRLTFERGCVEKIYLAEGESDCMVLVNSGLEELDPYSICVALPSASTFSKDWVPLFQNKEVILCLDNDNAGRAATNHIGKLIASVSKSVCVLDWDILLRGEEKACKL
jgi:hypothetical protein